MPIIFLIVFLLLGAASPARLLAQTSVDEATQTPEQLPSPPEELPSSTEQLPSLTIPRTNFASKFLKEQQELWESPAKIKAKDLKWLLPLGVGAAALLATDMKVSDAARDAEGLRAPSRFLSNWGGGASLGFAGGMFALGKLSHNKKVADTGLVAGDAVLHSQLVVHGLKMVFNRERPDKVGGHGGFWDGGRSFPSGHAATSFALATVLADRYKNKKLVVFGAYGLATAVSLSRIGGLNHHPSDVLIGAAIGHLIGRFVLNRHPAEE